MAKKSQKHIQVPSEGEKITASGGAISVPDQPIIAFIEGDGIGRDITAAMRSVVDGTVEKVYGGKRRIAWMEIYAGEKANKLYGDYLPEETTQAITEYLVAIKGPLTTPVGGGIRSLNVSLRKILDLYACVRPVRWYEGTPAPVKDPAKLDVVVFRENTEDVYAGIEYRSGTPEAEKVRDFFKQEMGDEFREGSGVGIKPISPFGTKRLVRKAIQNALDLGRRSVTLMHKGNIMKFTEGAFKEWGYELAKEEFRDRTVTERESWILANAEGKADMTAEENARKLEPEWESFPDGKKKEVLAEIEETLKLAPTHGGGKWKEKVLIKDRIADAMFQQILLRPAEYDVIACPNLNGDYISDACAAQVGGLGMAPGANIADEVALFEATHGTAPKYADKNMVNPGSLILSAVMMLDHLGWVEAAQAIQDAISATIGGKVVTYDLARQMEGATKVGTAEFGQAILENVQAAALAT